MQAPLPIPSEGVSVRADGFGWLRQAKTVAAAEWLAQTDVRQAGRTITEETPLTVVLLYFPVLAVKPMIWNSDLEGPFPGSGCRTLISGLLLAGGAMTIVKNGQQDTGEDNT